MHAIFPSALVECLKSGAAPTREQLGAVTRHIWRDWCRGFGLSCAGMPHDPVLASTMRSLAWLALTGDAKGPPLHWSEGRDRERDGHQLLDVA